MAYSGPSAGATTRMNTAVDATTSPITHNNSGVCHHTSAKAPSNSHGAWNNMNIVIMNDVRMMLTSLVIRTSRPLDEMRSTLP